jgi:WD40 repeat protein
LWDIAHGQVLYTLHGHTDRVISCAFSPSGQQVASGGSDRTVRLWDAHSGATGHTLHGHTNAVRAVAFSPDGRWLVSSSYDHTLRFWDAQTGQLLHTVPTWDTSILSIAFHPQLSLMAFGMNDHGVRLWEFGPSPEAGHLKMTLLGHTNGVEAVQFSLDGQWLASASADETIRIWDVATGERRQTLRADGPYADMNITGVTGISAAQRATLKALGAVED